MIKLFFRFGVLFLAVIFGSTKPDATTSLVEEDNATSPKNLVIDQSHTFMDMGIDPLCHVNLFLPAFEVLKNARVNKSFYLASANSLKRFFEHHPLQLDFKQTNAEHSLKSYVTKVMQTSDDAQTIVFNFRLVDISSKCLLEVINNNFLTSNFTL